MENYLLFETILCEEYDKLFKLDPEYEYAAQRTTPENLAKK